MPTPELLAHWFTFAPPSSPGEAEKHVAIRDAETACAAAISEAITGGDFAAVGSACFTFATVINEQCPESADKSAAIRCVRIARMAANEAVLQARKIGPATTERQASDLAIAANQCGGLALQHLTLARYQASSSIALGGR